MSTLPAHPKRVPVVIEQACSACAGCASVCPVDAIEMRPESAFISSRCTGCGICVRFCPLSAIQLAAHAGAGAQ